MLVDRGNGEPGQQDHEHEQVVDAQAVFGDVAGEELLTPPRTRKDREADEERGSEPDVEDHPPGGLAHPDGVWPATGHDQVRDDHDADADDGDEPDPQRHVHQD